MNISIYIDLLKLLSPHPQNNYQQIYISQLSTMETTQKQLTRELSFVDVSTNTEQNERVKLRPSFSDLLWLFPRKVVNQNERFGFCGTLPKAQPLTAIDILIDK